MKRIPRKKKKKIPVGVYCYTFKSGQYYCCPFWGINQNYPSQGNGYCSLIKKGDWDLSNDAIITDMKTGEIIKAESIPFSAGLLFDQVKECGYKEQY